MTIEKEIVTNLTGYLDLPIQLNPTQSVDLSCPWDWGEYVAKNVTIVVETQQGYSVYSDPITPVALAISSVVFNPIETDYFIFAVQNPTSHNLTLTTIYVAVDATSSDMTPNVVPPFPFSIPAATDYAFICYGKTGLFSRRKRLRSPWKLCLDMKSYTYRIPSVS